MNYTPTPWKRGIGNDCHKVRSKDGLVVATTDNPNDGTYIVLAANSHDALVKAAKAAKQLADDCVGTSDARESFLYFYKAAMKAIA